jgi:ABC-type Fe3+-siderophore transport system permease subunit
MESNKGEMNAKRKIWVSVIIGGLVGFLLAALIDYTEDLSVTEFIFVGVALSLLIGVGVSAITSKET